MPRTAQSIESVQLGFVGRKGYDFFKTRKVNMGPYYQPSSAARSRSRRRKKLADALIEQLPTGEVDEVKFIYNEFKNAVTQKSRRRELPAR